MFDPAPRWMESSARAGVARGRGVLHTEEVTGSNPVSPTKSEPGSGLPATSLLSSTHYFAWLNPHRGVHLIPIRDLRRREAAG